MTGFLLVWVNIAVGFLGNENNPANLMFFGLLGLTLVGALRCAVSSARPGAACSSPRRSASS